MKRYSKYKSSHFKWMGEIPESWTLTKNRYGFIKSDNGSNTDESTPVLSLTTRGVKIKQNLNFGKSSESYIGHQLVEVGDIVFTPRDFDQTPILSDVSKYFGCISNLYIVDKTKDNVLNHFVNYYWYGLKYSVNYFKNFSHGMRFSFNRFQFDEIPLLIPPLFEQHQIVHFLDEKTELIDKLISTKEKKISLLKEQRISLINQVVTKGLNPKVKMKDSGVECIGDIPEEWSMTRVSNFGKFFKGNGIKKDEVKSEEFSCIRYGEIYTKYDRVVYTPTSFIDEETSKNSVSIKKGDILFTGSGETVEDIGKSILFYGEEDIFVGGDIIVLRLNQGFNPLYLSYLLNSSFVQYQKSLMGRGEIIVHIYSKNIKEIRTPIPPQTEQNEIVQFLDEKTKEIDEMVQFEQKKIDLLKEYRQSLISEVVTGKIKVTE